MNDFGMDKLDEILENLEENNKIMEDMEKPWEEKLEEERAKDVVKAVERASFHGGSESGQRPELPKMTEETKASTIKA